MNHPESKRWWGGGGGGGGGRKEGGGGGGEEVRVEVCFAGCETLTDPFYEDILSFY